MKNETIENYVEGKEEEEELQEKGKIRRKRRMR